MTVKTDVNFRITGPCLSLLLRDCECSNTDQVGFLIGECTSVKTHTVSDAEMEEERIETTISINGTFPVGLPFVFCSPIGKVDEAELKNTLGSLEKDVVGWYSFRRNCRHSTSLLQTLLHQELRKIFKSCIPPEKFVFCIITKSENDNGATHSFKFTFFVMNYSRFQPVSITETNLGEPEDNTYKRTSATDHSKYFQKVVQTLNGSTNSKAAMLTLHREVDKTINTLQKRVSSLQEALDPKQTSFSVPSSNNTVEGRRAMSGDEFPPSTSAQGDLSAKY